MRTIRRRPPSTPIIFYSTFSISCTLHTYSLLQHSTTLNQLTLLLTYLQLMFFKQTFVLSTPTFLHTSHTVCLLTFFYTLLAFLHPHLIQKINPRCPPPQTLLPITTQLSPIPAILPQPLPNLPLPFTTTPHQLHPLPTTHSLPLLRFKPAPWVILLRNLPVLPQHAPPVLPLALHPNLTLLLLAINEYFPAKRRHHALKPVHRSLTTVTHPHAQSRTTSPLLLFF